MEPKKRSELTDEERTVFEALVALETETGRSVALNDVAVRAALPIERVRAVLSRLLNELGLVQEQPGDDLESPVYASTGRAGAGGRSAGAEQIEPNVAAQLERLVVGVRFPAAKDEVVRAAVKGGAPEALRFAMQQLPDDRAYLNVQDLADAVAEQMDEDVSA
jgi:hypothetical protein